MKIKKTKFFTLFISSFFLFALTGTTQAVDYYVPTTTSTVDGNTFCGGKCDSGDKIIIRGGARGSLLLQNFDGAGSYITITNENKNPDSRVMITSNGDSGTGILSVNNCKYIDLRGDNDGDLMYGIKVRDDGSPSRSGAVKVYGESDHIKISYLEIDHIGSTSLTTGIGIQVNDKDLSCAWTFDTFEIHHNYIHNTRYSGMYLGYNDPLITDNPYISNFSVHDNLLEDLGTYGITTKGIAASSNPILVYNNTIRGSSGGMSTGLVDPSTSGMGIGFSRCYGDSYVVVYDNWIEKTAGPGIKAGKNGIVYNNTIVGCGLSDSEKWGHGIVTNWYADGTQLNDNIIIQPKRYGIYAEWATYNVLHQRNLIGDAGLGEIGEFDSWGDGLIEGTSVDANIYHANVADFNFNAWSDDGDYSNDDFGLSATPPADHNWYFSMSGGGDVCSEASPCKWLSSKQVGYVEGQTTAQDKIDGVDGSKTVNLYFKRGDVWTFNTPAVAKVINYGLFVGTDDPTVHIDAYGSGAKPKFYGNVSDFSLVPHDNTSTGPFRWNNVVRILKDDCSVKNMHFDGLYGHAVWLGAANIPTDRFTLESCDITNFGSSALTVSNTHATRDTLVTKNLIHTGQELIMHDKMEALAWSAAVTFNPAANAVRAGLGNVFSYNVLYDIGGEGCLCYGCIMEYNIVGNTSSIALFGAAREVYTTDTIIRYNLVTMSDRSTHLYDNQIGQGADGIAIIDERPGGENKESTAQIYGNVVINREKGIFFNDSTVHKGGPDPILTTYKAVRIYNNTVIDSNSYNYILSPYHYSVGAGNGFFYNNLSVFYNKTGSEHVADWGDPVDLADFWTIDNNAFWTTGGSPTVDIDWQTNMITTDPKLTGELAAIDWDGQSGPTYYKDIKFSDIIPLAGSSLIGSGKTLDASYSKTFLTQGTNFDTLPNIPNFMLSSQTDGSWDVGAVEVGGTTVSTCLTEGYQCCSSCQSGPHSEYDSDCFGGICCETCSIPLPPIPTPDPTCADLGTCCPAGQLCSGIGKNLPGCENVCCTGGTCIDPPASAVCQYKGYQCCNSCKLDPQPDYDGTCPGGEVCCALCVYAPPPPLGEVGVKNPLKTSDFSKMAENILLWSLSIIGSLALLVIIFGGVMYIGSAGDEQKAFTAKKIITFAIFGLMVILGAYAIVKALSEVVT